MLEIEKSRHRKGSNKITEIDYRTDYGLDKNLLSDANSQFM